MTNEIQNRIGRFKVAKATIFEEPELISEMMAVAIPFHVEDLGAVLEYYCWSMTFDIYDANSGQTIPEYEISIDATEIKSRRLTPIIASNADEIARQV